MTTEQRKPLIELKNIHKTFGETKVLEGINLTVYEGEALVIIGPSGTGKSTILRIMAGLIAPDEGEIYLRGEKRTQLAEDGQDLMRISLVFQQSALFDSLTVQENVGFMLYENATLRLSEAEIKTLVEEKLAMVGLQGISDRYPSQLSGGMRKRVSFARAIMTNPQNNQENPEIILYDEPTAGLDPISSTIIEDLVRSLQTSSGGCETYVMVSHQDSTIRRTADRVILMYGGQIQWQGQVEEIDQTDNSLIRQFFSASVTGPIQVT
ncbi:MAG: ABC transporter ATP-binding protein [Microcystaceae cyanobacterium]